MQDERVKKAAKKRLGINNAPAPPNSQGLPPPDRVNTKTNLMDYYSYPTKERFDRAPLGPREDNKWLTSSARQQEDVRKNMARTRNSAKVWPPVKGPR